jgi:hypothetical protein
VDVSSGEEPPRQQGLALEVPEDVDVPIRALVTLHDPDAAVLEGPSASADVPAASPGTQEPVMIASLVSPSPVGPTTASATADLSARETHPAELTATSSAIAPAEPTAILPAVASSSGGVSPLASTVVVQPSKGARPQEPIVPSSAITTSLLGQVCLILFNYFGLFPLCLTHPLFCQNLDLSELLAFDPASIGSAILEADDSPLGLTSIANRLLYMKDLLSGPIDALIQDSSAVKQILDEVNSQLPVSLQVKLLPAGYLPFFRAKVAEARHRIETRRSQSLLRTIITEMCQSVNKKKAALDAKVDTSASAQWLHLLERELEDLEAKVRATKQRIQEEKDLIVGSKQEAAVLSAELKADLAELSSLSKQVVPGADEEDEAMIAEVDRIRLDAIAAIDDFLQKTRPR